MSNPSGLQSADLRSPIGSSKARKIIAAINSAFGAGPVSTVFGRVGAVVAQAEDYASSLIANDSSVAGTTVKDALETLLLLATGGINSVTSVFGRGGAVVAALGDYAASLVSNDSSISGSSVKDALNTLGAAIPSVPVVSVFGRIGGVVATAGDYSASLVSNNSSVSGSAVKDALNTLLAAITESAGPTLLAFGAILEGEVIRRVGTHLSGRFVAVVGPSSAVSDPGDTANHDVTGLTVSLPRAGTYWFHFVGFLTCLTNPTTMGLGVAFSGTTTELLCNPQIITTTASTSFRTQTVSDTLPSGGVTATNVNPWHCIGKITVSTAGDLNVRFNRAANTISFAAGGGGFVIEK
jgi:hypothetical protein